MKKVLFVILAIALCTTSSFAADVSLPSDYVQVEYLEGTGTQYIDTGFIPNQDTRVMTEHLYTKQPVNRGFIYGAGVSATSRAFEVYSWTNIFNSPYGNTNINLSPSSSSLFVIGKITIDKNKNNVTIQYGDGTLQTNSGEYVTFDAPGNMWLFSINRGFWSESLTADCVQLYYCKIFDNGTLVRDFIPCYRKSDGEAGMYDLVTNKFYTNAGTGKFLVGPEIIIPDVPDVPDIPDLPDIPSDSMTSMDAFFAMMSGIVNTMKTPMNIWGFAFSLWDVFMFSMVSTVIFGFIGKLFNM